MFLGSFEGGIDVKGRVSIPASFRAALGGSMKVILWPSVDGSGCLEGGGEPLVESYRAILSQMSPNDPVRRSFQHVIFTKSFELNLDSNGRIGLPQSLVKAAGLEDRVLFAGADDRFHIWNPDRYAEFDAQMSQMAQDSQDKLEQPFREALSAGLLRRGGGS